MITLALMCRAMKCTPSDLRQEDPEEIKYLTYIYSELASKNPMGFFGG